MKRFFALCAMCAIIIACGSNPGVEYLEKAKAAADKGKLEQAERNMERFEEWYENLPVEEAEKYDDAIDEWMDANGDALEDKIYELKIEKYKEELGKFGEKAADYLEGLGADAAELAQDIMENSDEYAEQAMKAAEEFGEDAKKWAEDFGENADEYAEQAVKAAAEFGENAKEWAEDFGENADDVALDVAKSIESAAEDAVKAIEGMFE